MPSPNGNNSVAPKLRRPIGPWIRAASSTLFATAFAFIASLGRAIFWEGLFTPAFYSAAFKILLVTLVVFMVQLSFDLGLPPGAAGRRWRVIFAATAVPLSFITLMFTNLYMASGTCLGFIILYTCVIIAWSALVARHQFRGLRELVALGAPLSPKEMTSGDQALFSHVTDLHITGADDIATLEGDKGGLIPLRAWLVKMRAIAPSYLLLSGDITDTGSRKEWERVRAVLRDEWGGQPRIFACPGNHDVSRVYNEPNEHGLKNFLDFQRDFCPDLLAHDGRNWSAIQRDFSEQYHRDIQIHASAMRNAFVRDEANVAATWTFGAKRRRAALRAIILKASKIDWKAQALLPEAETAAFDKHLETIGATLFPFYFVDADKHVGIISLNSVANRSKAFESALGEYGDAQLNEFANVLDAVSSKSSAVIVVTHHGLCRKDQDLKLFAEVNLTWRGLKRLVSRVKEYALLTFEFEETRRFFRILEDTGSRHAATRYYVVCGHRHAAMIGWIGRVLVLEGCDSSRKATHWLVCQRKGTPDISVFNEGTVPAT